MLFIQTIMKVSPGALNAINKLICFLFRLIGEGYELAKSLQSIQKLIQVRPVKNLFLLFIIVNEQILNRNGQCETLDGSRKKWNGRDFEIIPAHRHLSLC